jgi:hypothetical protein
MLDAFVIEEIRRRERETSRDDRPAIELPIPNHEPAPDSDADDVDGGSGRPERGVVIIDYAS